MNSLPAIAQHLPIGEFFQSAVNERKQLPRDMRLVRRSGFEQLRNSVHEGTGPCRRVTGVRACCCVHAPKY